ncbi:MAG: hypothetical protein AAF446_06330 [Pseudomonadota bacterium]
MRFFHRALLVSAICIGTFGLNTVLSQVTEAAQAQPAQVSVETLLDWIERHRRIGADSAELLRQSLDRQADPAARLELALLELHAPLADTVSERGLERLDVLVTSFDHVEPFEWLTPAAERLLRLWLDQARQVQTLRLQAQASAERLELERRAHLGTLEKLEALRSIERELEQRPAVDDLSGAEDDQDPADGPGR